MPQDCNELRQDVSSCLPSLVIDGVAQPSGQRVVYFCHFDDSKIPSDIPIDSGFLHGWGSWGPTVLKVVAGASPGELTRFQAESALLEELKSPSFPKLHFAEYFSGNPITETPFISPLYITVEECIDSVPLSQCMNAYSGDYLAVCKLSIGIVDALTPLWGHRRRFVHRDIKPANLLIRPNGDVVVIDLGIIRETGAIGVTADGWGKAPLTVDYAAPEQIANDKDAIGFRTDFFAIGVLMYQMISGFHPFRTNGYMSDYDVAMQVEAHSPKTLAELQCAPNSMSDLVSKLMEKAPHRRPRTIEDFKGLLQKVMGN
jgi:serine/threonine protein kinase